MQTEGLWQTTDVAGFWMLGSALPPSCGLLGALALLWVPRRGGCGSSAEGPWGRESRVGCLFLFGLCRGRAGLLISFLLEMGGVVLSESSINTIQCFL